MIGTRKGRRLTAATGLLLAGVSGNLFDRLFREPGPFHGHVIDFLDTGADGVLLIRCLDDCEVMVPMVDEFVTVDVRAGLVFVPQLDEFRV